MYLEKRDIKALKVLVQSMDKVARTTSRNAKAINQLAKLLQQNDKRVKQQRRIVKGMTKLPTTKNNNSPWD